MTRINLRFSSGFKSAVSSWSFNLLSLNFSSFVLSGFNYATDPKSVGEFEIIHRR